MRCPHTRGGVPRAKLNHKKRAKLSPHTWGCSDESRGRSHQSRVVPTHVGVFLASTCVQLPDHCCPHTRGGVPWVVCADNRRIELSPHTWGCSSVFTITTHSSPVVPTHVGVFRQKIHIIITWHSCPHTRGGVPSRCSSVADLKLLSPHTRGCSSTWRNFGFPAEVVPTHVGVFRRRSRIVSLNRRCPHTRGGVPLSAEARPPGPSLSPHTWGCSVNGQPMSDDLNVVPTHVGVFRMHAGQEHAVRRCPHTRGGVPTRSPPPSPP